MKNNINNPDLSSNFSSSFNNNFNYNFCILSEIEIIKNVEKNGHYFFYISWN